MFESLFTESGLSLDRLRSFLAIVEARGIMAAAKGDASRQSQLSRQLAELETFFGSSLVNRSRKTGFSLTDEGENLRAALVQAFGSLEAIKNGVANSHFSFRIGAGESVLAWLVLPRLATLRAAFPESVPHCLNLRSEEIGKRLADGSLDLGIVRRPLLQGHILCAEIQSCGYSLAVPKALWKRSKGNDLASLPLAVLDDSTSLQELEQAAKGKPLNILCRCTSYGQVRSAVVTGECAALVPDFMTSELERSDCRVQSVPRLKLRLLAAWNPQLLKTRRVIEAAVRWAVEEWLVQ